MVDTMTEIVTDADVAFYQENGYWIAPKLLTDDEIALFREHHARVLQGEYETRRPPHSRSNTPGEPIEQIVKIDNSYWSDSMLAKLALHPVIGKVAARLAGAVGIRLWHDQLLYKPPQNAAASAVGWHQDYYYWQCTTPANLLTAWVALVDVDETNGCMEVVPGSHKWGLQEESDFFEQDLDALRNRIEQQTGQPFQSVPCVLPAGSVSFHHCLTLHGSRPNLSDGPRISLVVHMQPDGTRYRAGTSGDAHMNVALLSGADGDPFAGPYFPVIYREGDAAANPWDVVE
jgi:ectoine hydroxylase-related dioxygenase (phytanoyl-CoA dioxygenase family)